MTDVLWGFLVLEKTGRGRIHLFVVAPTLGDLLGVVYFYFTPVKIREEDLWAR